MSDFARITACSRARLGISYRATTVREWCTWVLVLIIAIPAAAFPVPGIFTIVAL